MPRITTTLNRLRFSGKMCPEGWSTILTGLGKTKADDEPLDPLICLPIVGHHDTLWQLSARPEYDAECRALAVSFARHVQHLANDPAAQLVLDNVKAFLGGQATAAEMFAAIPAEHQTLTLYEDHAYDLCDQEEAAISAAVMATMPNGSLAPFIVAKFAEEAEFKAHGDSGRKAAEWRHTEELRAFLSQ